jgi:hypothetical protein
VSHGYGYAANRWYATERVVGLKNKRQTFVRTQGWLRRGRSGAGKSRAQRRRKLLRCRLEARRKRRGIFREPLRQPRRLGCANPRSQPKRETLA